MHVIRMISVASVVLISKCTLQFRLQFRASIETMLISTVARVAGLN
jgi:hypothetical protein